MYTNEEIRALLDVVEQLKGLSIAAQFVALFYRDEYQRPHHDELAAAGELRWSSNWTESCHSFSPNCLWRMEDGSWLWVGYSYCEVMSAESAERFIDEEAR